MLLLTSFVALAVFVAMTMSFDGTIVRACEERGYWQTGQIRVLCDIEYTRSR